MILKKETEKMIIELALKEDIGSLDITSEATVSDNVRGIGSLKVKERCVLAGIDVASKILHIVDKSMYMEVLVSDGDEVAYGSIVARIEGDLKVLLRCERTVLNFMQRMSGIATLTSKYVQKVKDTKAEILDTRKTVPGMRFFDKEAVLIGGGKNHRYGLYDMILIKNNHIAASECVSTALKKAKDYARNHNFLGNIEIEVRTMNEFYEVLDQHPDIIMLDNFSLSHIKDAMAYLKKRRDATDVKIEVSGGINLDNVLSIAELGVDYISVGELTHSAPAVDISMEITKVTA